MGANRLLSALPPDFLLTVVDVGSAGGLHPRWAPYRSAILAILFDPREDKTGGEPRRGGTRTYPVALGENDGEARLHLTALANMSSFLEPNRASLSRFEKKGEDTATVDTVSVPIRRLDSLAAADRISADVLKVDTQGSELMVLRGAEAALGATLLAEIEVSFFERYAGQPLFRDIERHMAERGFELIELNRLKRYRAANAIIKGKRSSAPTERSGRIAYADAIFLRREEEILARSREEGAALLRAIVAALAYGKLDIACRLLELGREHLDGGVAEGVAQALRRFDRPRGLRRLLAALRGTG